MADTQKDIIYIDVDDEITAVIDKVSSSKSKIVALVLPKRATVFHSIVNMKLLRRASDESKKHVALITSETGILPLAGMVGLHVAKTPQSKPVIPPAPSDTDATETITEEESKDVEIDATKPIGALAGLPSEDEDETIEVDNADTVASETPTPKKAGGKKLKIPNFEKFRTRLFLGIAALVLLIIGWVYAVMIAPKAKIVIKTDTTNIASNITLTASPKAKELQKEEAIVPAINKEYKKTDALKAPATGQKNKGEKAKGTVKIYNCNKDDKLSDTVRTVPAGTTVKNGGFTFVLNESAQVEPSSFTGDTCQRNKPSASTAVTAQDAGDQYNLSARKYSVSNFPSMEADGSNMTGGTSQIVKVVSQQDVDSAKQKILDQNLQAAKDELSKQLKTEGYLPVPDTLAAGNPVVTATPNVGDEGSEVNVNIVVTYAMLGAKESDVKQLVEDDIKKHIDASKQAILDNGLSKATVQILEKRPNGDYKLALQSEAVAGVQQDIDSIKRTVAGKKRGETVSLIQGRPGVKDVNVSYSPFWVFSTPKKLSKITITFEQSSNSGSNP